MHLGLTWSSALVALAIHTTSFQSIAQSYGLETRPSIGPFLNGQLPKGTPGGVNGDWTTVVAYPNLTFDDPVAFVPDPRTNRIYVCCRQGTIYSFANDPATTTKTLFLDIRSKTQGWDDCGLLSMALHPEFGVVGSPNRGYVYVHYQYSPAPTTGPGRPANNQPGYNRLSRFTVPVGSSVADPNSEQVLVNQFDESVWHNGGALFFGPDGFLYFSNGDEGLVGDQLNNSQKINGGLFGGVFRIDVNRDATKSHPIRRQPQVGGVPPAGWPATYTQNYYVPNDNPFVNPNGSVLEEFWALGFRSPHRMTCDSVTGRIWMGDVGQGEREEVNVIVKGGNYQWAYLEGTFPGPKAKPNPIVGVDKPPIYEYGRGNGDACIIGGYVYRGTQFASELGGKYIFGDNTSDRVWTLNWDGVTPPTVAFLVNGPVGSGYTGISSFGVDQNGEIYLCKMGTGSRIYKLARNGASNPQAPALLSQTGAFADLATLKPAEGVIPYNVNAPLWSDGAAKARWMAVPNNGAPYDANETISFSATGEWAFPNGTVFVKHFELPIDDRNPAIRKRLETRLLVRETNGAVYGVTYKWRANNSDADLLTNSLSENINITTTSGGTRVQTWYYPSRQDCLTCHNPNANYVLGVKTRHLNGNYTYPSAGVPSIVVDNSAATVVDAWSTGSSATDKFGADYRFHNQGTGAGHVQFTPNIQTAGNYDVYEWHSQGGNRGTDTPHVISYNGGTTTVRLNQQSKGGQWNLLGRFNFASGTAGSVRITDAISTAGQIAMADAIKFSFIDTSAQTPGVTDNQLRALNHIGMFNTPLNEANIPGYAKTVAVTDTTASLETRVRSYLDANCAQCHRPNGVQAYFDARFDTTLQNQNIVGGPIFNTLGIADAQVVSGQNIPKSIMHLRMNTNGTIKMPPLARSVVDTDAVAALSQWINSLPPSMVQGLILEKYNALGGPASFLGQPLTYEQTCPDGIGKFNHFEGGSIYWSPATGAWSIHGAIRDKWAALGWEQGFLGYPTSDESPCPDGVGRFNMFQFGAIYWTPTFGAYSVQGEIYNKWASLGWETSAHGYPTSDEYDWNGGRRSDFQVGFIFWTATSGAFSSTELPPRAWSQGKNDFNNDGRADIVTFVRGGGNAGANVPDGNVYVALSTGTTFGAGNRWHEFFASGFAVPDTGDFNGDGRTDIIAFNRGGNSSAVGNVDGDIHVALSSGSSFGTRTKWHEFFSFVNQIPMVGDFNGDSRDDVITFARGGGNGGAGVADGDVYVALSSGSGFGARSKWHEFFCVGNEIPGVGDVNRDGRDDIILFKRGGGNAAVGVPDGDVFVALSTGNGFGTAQKWNEFFCMGNEYPVVADVNGDGRADILTFVRGGGNAGVGVPDGDVYVALSNGTGFSGGGKWNEFFSIGGELPGAADFTGDGRADIVTFVRGGGNAGANVPDGNVYVAPSNGNGFLGGAKWHEFFSIGGEVPLPATNLGGK